MICNDVQKLIDYAIKKELITNDDIYVVRNQLMEALKLTDWESNNTEYRNETIDEILAPMIDYACENNIINDTSNSRDLFDTKLMGILTPMPREVVAEFNKRYAVNPKEATDWYFDFSKNLNYVRAGRIEKDLKWTYDCEYGRLDITINCSKPEKDPRDIAAAKTQKVSAYPECQLCPENAGFAGHANVVCEAFDNPEAKAMLVNAILERNAELASQGNLDKQQFLVAASGMAGFGEANEITTRRISKKFFLCGDGKSDVNAGIGLIAPRVMLCAAHQAITTIRIICSLVASGFNNV